MSGANTNVKFYQNFYKKKKNEETHHVPGSSSGFISAAFVLISLSPSLPGGATD